MESIAASSGLTPLLRPAIPLQGDLGAILQEGRILSGEVLERFAGGSILIGVGEHRVAAEAQVELQPGQRFRFQTEARGGEIVLRLIDHEPGRGEAPWLRAVRALAGRELSPERFMAQLATRIEREVQASADLPARLEAWARAAQAEPSAQQAQPSGPPGGNDAGGPREPSAATAGNERLAGLVARAGVRDAQAFVGAFLAGEASVASLEARVASVVEAELARAAPDMLREAGRAGVEQLVERVVELWHRRALALLRSGPGAASSADSLAQLVSSLERAAGSALNEVLRAPAAPAVPAVTGTTGPTAGPALDPGSGWLPAGRVLRLLLSRAHAGAEPDSAAHSAPTASPASSSELPVLTELFRRASALVFQPGVPAPGADARTPAQPLPGVVRPSSPLLEGAFSTALLDAGIDTPRRALGSLGLELQRMLGQSIVGAAGEASFSAVLKHALADVAAQLGDARRVDHALLRELGAGLLEGLARGLERQGGPQAAARAARLRSLPGARAWVGREGVLLRALLALGDGQASGPLAALRAAAMGTLDADERGALQRALLELGDASVRDALARMLVGVDLEHLLNLARREAGEPLHWSFPVHEGDLPGRAAGDGWTAAHLFVSWRDERRREQGERAPDGGTWRFTVGVDFSQLGTVHAQFVLRPASLSVRVGLERPEIVELLQARSAELVEALAATAGERELSLHIALEAARPVDVARSGGTPAGQIRYLRERHLMDVEG